MTRSVFQATFYDQKPLKTHGSHLFVFEVPNELADEALRILGGLPRHAKENAVWVGIARIDPDKANPEKAVSEAPKPADDAEKERKPFSQWSLPQQAAMRCNQPLFRGFLEDRFGLIGAGPELAAAKVREYCGVVSRAKILPNTPAGNRYLLLESAFQAWLREPEHVAWDHPL